MTHFFEHGYALLIGVNENDTQKLSLPAAEKDVDALYKVLSNPKRCGYRAGNIKLLKGDDATRAGILKGLKWLKERLNEDAADNATVWFFFSGHGAKEGKGKTTSYHLIPKDFDQEIGLASAIRAQEVAVAVAKMKPGRLIAVLDCCHAEGMNIKGDVEFFAEALPPSAFEAIFDSESKEGHQKNLEALQQGTGRAVLSSSSASESSFVRSDRKMSVFTYHLIEALTGYASVNDKATEVLVSDVMSYMTRIVPETVKRDYGCAQTPQYQISGNFPLALLAGGNGIQKGENLPHPLEVSGDEPSREKDVFIDQKGDGAIAVGDHSIAVGKGGVMIGGNATNVRINTGNQIS